MMKISVPFPAPLPPSLYWRVGEEGENGSKPSRYGRRLHLLWTKLEHHHLNGTREHRDSTHHQKAEWTLTSPAEALNLGAEEKASIACCVKGLEDVGEGGRRLRNSVGPSQCPLPTAYTFLPCSLTPLILLPSKPLPKVT